MEFSGILIGSEDPERLIEHYTRVLGEPERAPGSTRCSRRNGHGQTRRGAWAGQNRGFVGSPDGSRPPSRSVRCPGGHRATGTTRLRPRWVKMRP